MIRLFLYNIRRKLEFRKLKPDMEQVPLARETFLEQHYIIKAETYLEWITAARMLSQLLGMKLETYLNSIDGKHMWRMYRYIEASRLFDRIECTNCVYDRSKILFFNQFSELYLISVETVKLRNYEHLL